MDSGEVQLPRVREAFPGAEGSGSGAAAHIPDDPHAGELLGGRTIVKSALESGLHRGHGA